MKHSKPRKWKDSARQREQMLSAAIRKGEVKAPTADLPDSVGRPTAADVALRSGGCVRNIDTGNIDYRLDKAKRHRR